MKLLSFLTLTALLSISSCSHFQGGKSCCAKKDKMSCSKDHCEKCDKHKEHKEKDKVACADGSCHKKNK